MTNPPAPIPAGWYEDSTAPGTMRWWDGIAWTQHTSPAAPGSGAAPGSAAPGYTAAPERQLLPADRPIYSAFIWVITLLPLLTYLSLFAYQPDFSYLGRLGADPSSSGTSVEIFKSTFTPGYFLIVGEGFVLYALVVVLAARDRAWLIRQGVERPFHWAFAFFGGLVYVIGRSVIVRRVAPGRGLVPVWVMIGVFVVGLIISGIWTASLMSSMYSQIGYLGR